ncbi:hypothetical protein ElyMa_004885100 [Elysia marginata]|uniref:Uncharacterized protein n=1 Tax=Elysia marginata TaxID=1093978 RepID=A0AAV4IVN8_9GAST|nr:hypothetical protein ElyMa_004885100 [Elysia marginata]
MWTLTGSGQLLSLKSPSTDTCTEIERPRRRQEYTVTRRPEASSSRWMLQLQVAAIDTRPGRPRFGLTATKGGWLAGWLASTLLPHFGI